MTSSQTRSLRPPARAVAASLAIIGVVNVVAEVIRAVRWPAATDEISVVTGADVLRSGSRCLYCPDVQTQIQRDLVGGHLQSIGLDPFRNPPLVAWLTQPLGAVPLAVGAAIIEIVSVAGLIGAIYLVTRLLAPRWDRRSRYALATAAATVLPGGEVFTYVQWDAVLLFCAAGAATALHRGHQWRAGLMLSVLLMKPQLVWIVVPCVAAAGAWMAVGGMVIGGLAWFGSGIVIVGGDWWIQWIRATGWDAYLDASTNGIPGVIDYLTGSTALGTMAAATLALLMTAGLWTQRRWLRADRAAVVALGVGLSLLASPHVYSHDFVLLAVPLGIWAGRFPRSALCGIVALDAAYLLELPIPYKTGHVQALALLSVMAAMTWQLRRGMIAAGHGIVTARTRTQGG